MTPTIGRIVHLSMTSRGERVVRPAIVTAAFEGASHVDLEVQLTASDVADLRPDELKQLKFRASVNQGKGYPASVGEWQWPPAVSAAIVEATTAASVKARQDGVDAQAQSAAVEAAAIEAERNLPIEAAVKAAAEAPPPAPTAPPVEAPAPSKPDLVKPAPKSRR